MKLPIKKEYFDAIEKGDKRLEYRDAHLTFVCESTGRELRLDVDAAKVIPIDRLPKQYQGKGLFEDDHVICFLLGGKGNEESKKEYSK